MRSSRPQLNSFFRAIRSLGFLYWFYFFSFQCLLVIFAIALIEGNIGLAAVSLILANLGFFPFVIYARSKF